MYFDRVFVLASQRGTEQISFARYPLCYMLLSLFQAAYFRSPAVMEPHVQTTPKIHVAALNAAKRGTFCILRV